MPQVSYHRIIPHFLSFPSAHTEAVYYGGAEWPLGRSGSAPSTDHHADRQRDRQLSSSLAVWPAAVPVCLSAAATTDYLPQLEAQTG